MVALDIGANFGDVAAVIADCVGPSGRVVPFEASPDNAERLRGCVVEMPQVEVCDAAVTDQQGTTTPHLDSKSSKRHSLFEAAVSVRGITVGVPMVTLGVIADELACVDFIKIDVQGAEGRILAGEKDCSRATTRSCCSNRGREG